jgi:hypothetical protein
MDITVERRELNARSLIRLWPTGYAGRVTAVAEQRTTNPMSLWMSFAFYDGLWDRWAAEQGMTWLARVEQIPDIERERFGEWAVANDLHRGTSCPYPFMIRHIGISPEGDGTLWYDEIIPTSEETDPMLTFNGRVGWFIRAPLKKQLREPVPPSWYRHGNGLLTRGGER